MAGGNMGDLWFTLGVRNSMKKEINQALLEIKNVDGAISKLNRNLVAEQKKLNAAYKRKTVDQAAVSRIQKEINLWTKGVDNALSYQQMLQRVRLEMEKLQSLRNISVGVDKSKLNEAYELLRKFSKDLRNVGTIYRRDGRGVGGVDANTYMSRYAKALTNTLRDVHALENSYRKDSTLTDAASRASQLERALAKVQTQLLRIKALQSEAGRNGYNGGVLLGAGNRLRALESHLKTMLNNPKTFNSESQYRKVLSDVGTAAHKTALAIARYNEEKRKSRSNATSLSADARAARDLAAAFDRIRNSASRTSGVLNDIKSLFLQGGIVYGAQQFFNEVVRTGGEIVQQHIALQTIVGDLQNANELFGQVQELALRSPFTFGELNRDVKQLAAFGVETENLYDMTRRLADVSSGLGVSFERLGLAYGQVKARSWLDGKELRQFAYAGLPMLQKLADYYSKTRGGAYTTSQVRSMITKREVSFEDVDAIFKELTDEGGQFYNMQDKLSATLLGRYMKLKDAWDIMLSKLADGRSGLGGFLSWALDRVTSLVITLDKLGPVIIAAFAGPALRKGLTMLGGAMGVILLKAKQQVAAKYQELGITKKLSAEQMRIVKTKNQITVEDLRNKGILQQINQQEARRLFITGQITKEQYKMISALNAQGAATRRNALSQFMGAGNWGARGKALGGLIAGGIRNVASGIMGFFGGPIGIGISAALAGITYLYQKHQELVEAQRRAQEELLDRSKQIKEFSENYNVSDTIAKGRDSVDNAIEAYKKKLKELAPYNEEIYSMGANEKKSHEERLKYLAEQLKLLQEANKEARKRSDDFIDDTKSSFESLKDINAKVNDPSLILDLDVNAFVPTGNHYVRDEKTGDINHIAEAIIENFQAVGKDPKVTEAARMAVEEMFAQISISPEQKVFAITRISDALRDISKGAVRVNWGQEALKGMVRERLQDIISTAKVTLGKGVTETGEQLSNKIKYGQQLTKAEKDKIAEMYSIAKESMKKEYPELANELQALLDNSNFTAQIRLNFVSGKMPGSFETDIMKQTPVMLRYYNVVQRYARMMDQGYVEAQGAYEKAVKDAKDNWQKISGNKKLSQDKKNTAKQEYDDLVAANNYLGFTGLDTESKTDKRNKKKNRTGTPKDTELERVRNRVELYKKFYNELNKQRDLEGEGALSTLKADDNFKSVFGYGLTEIENYSKSLDELTKGLKATTEARRKFLDDTSASKATKKREDANEAIQQTVAAMNKEISTLRERSKTYKEIFNLTGNATTASNVAFGLNTTGEPRDVKEYVRRRLGTNADNIISMDRSDMEKKYGKDSETANLYNAYQEADKDDLEEANRLAAQLIEKNRTIQMEIDAENASYEEQKKLLAGNKELLDDLEKGHSQRIGDLNFRKFKESSDFETIFRNYDKVSVSSLKELRSGLVGQLGSDMSPESVKAIIEALDKIDDYLEKNSPFKSLADNFSRLSMLNSIRRDSARVDENGNIHMSAGEASNLGIKVRANGAYTKNDLDSAERQITHNMITNVEAISGAFSSLNDVLQPVEDLFSALGNTGLKKGFGIAGGAFSSASKTAGAFGNLTNVASAGGMEGVSKILGNAGPYGAAAAAALSVATSLFGGKPASLKAYEKQAAYLKEIRDTTSKIESNLQKNISTQKGASVSVATAAQLRAARAAEANEERRTYYSWTNAKEKHGGNRNRMKTGLDYDLLNDWLTANGWDGRDYNGNIMTNTSVHYNSQTGKLEKKTTPVTYVGSQEIQRLDPKLLRRFMNENPEAWAHMNSQAREYLENLMDIADKQEDLTQQLAEAAAGFNTDSLLSSWSELLNQMSVSSADFADKFEESLRKAILNTMLYNTYKDQIDKLTDDAVAYTDTKSGYYLSKRGGVRKHTGGDDTADVYSEITPTEAANLRDRQKAITDSATQTKEYLDDVFGWHYGSSSMSSSIQGITENTADLLASYINAMRADVSIIRQSEGLYLPKLDITTEAQLQQLNMISANTLRNADAAERIESSVGVLSDILSKSANGMKPLSVTVA